MKNRTFYIILAAVMLVCIVFTVLHLVYIINAYEHCSIIRFIAGEGW